MTTQERIQMLEEALELIERAQQLVDDAVNGTGNEANYEAYGKYGFNQLLGNGNPYDDGIPSLIVEFNDESDDN